MLVIQSVSDMPELPELQVISRELTDILVGHSIKNITVHNHIVVHGLPVDEFTRRAVGEIFQSVRADGKFIIMALEKHDIVINPMLTGRFRTVSRYKKPIKRDMISIQTTGETFWYSDLKKMGRVYLVPTGDYSQVAGFGDRGPSALDPKLTLDVFKERLKQRNGQIKNVLRNQRFVKGIGNAYADEILVYAGILPFRKRSSLTEDEIEKLYESMRKVLTRIRDVLSGRSLSEIAIEKRDFMMIHNKGGGMCPLCGGRISEVKANRFKTNYCQTCQS
ncbi:MAG: Fpg/Nei family DNA glycosylase [Candidatus Thorarchaeota archaeon]